VTKNPARWGSKGGANQESALSHQAPWVKVSIGIAHVSVPVAPVHGRPDFRGLGALPSEMCPDQAMPVEAVRFREKRGPDAGSTRAKGSDLVVGLYPVSACAASQLLLAGQDSRRRLFRDIPQLFFAQFFFGLIPKLIIPTIWPMVL